MSNFFPERMHKADAFHYGRRSAVIGTCTEVYGNGGKETGKDSDEEEKFTKGRMVTEWNRGGK